MKLFGDFDAVRFPEENLLFITRGGYIYYIYDPEYKHWRKHRNAGFDRITVNNYPDADKAELTEAMDGRFPARETDFMRFCSPLDLYIRDMLDLFKEDYPDYMADRTIFDAVHAFLLNSDICSKSYMKLREIFGDALALGQDHEQLLDRVMKLSYAVIGRDIFRREIGIVDGHDTSSYFWIMPVRVIDYSDTNSLSSVAQMKSVEISIEEDDVDQ